MHFLIFFLFCMTSLAHAEADPRDIISLMERDHYTQALRESGGDPLVRDIILWQAFQYNDFKTSFKTVTDHIKRHPDWPLNERRVRKAENALVSEADNLSKDVIKAWFADHFPRSVQALDLAYEAELDKEKAQNMVRSWWHDAHISKKDQDYVLKIYKGTLRAEDNAQRLKNLLKRKRYSNARALAEYMGDDYELFITAYIGLRDNKGDVNGRLRALPTALRNDPLIALERVRWRRKNDHREGAIAMLQTTPAEHQDADWWRERHIIIRELLEEKNYKQAYVLAHHHAQDGGFAFVQASFVAGWIGLRFADQPYEAFKHFEALYNIAETPISKARGAFWAGQAAEALGHADVASAWYNAAAKYPQVFYGQQALRLLKVKTTLTPPASEITQDSVMTISDESVQALMWLHQAGAVGWRDIFMHHLTRTARTPRDFARLEGVALKTGYQSLSVFAARRAARYDVHLSPKSAYPVLPDNLLDKLSVDPRLAHAIMRQESSFDPYALSPAGAMGYMQLMNDTAREMAQSLNLPYSKSRLLNNHDLNIVLGSGYLQKLLQQSDQQVVLAVASYNAGPSRVRQWLETYGDPRTGEIDWLDWIEIIPYYETRNYVQRVSETYFIYRELL